MTTIELTCKYCNTCFSAPYSRRDKAKYCTQKCAKAALRIPDEKLIRICPTCKREFKPTRTNLVNQEFCSRQCLGASKKGSNPYRRGEDIPVEILAEYVDLNEDTGILKWKKCPDTTIKTDRDTGMEAGKIYGKNKYKNFTLLGKVISCHRAAWALHHGKWPENDIDHEDRNGTNNRPNNLREATKSQNEYNKVARTPCGYRGVYQSPSGNFRARLFFNGKRRNGGTFDTAEKAYEARKKLEVEFGVHEFCKN